MKIIARNKKGLFDYFIIEKFEAGIVLKGSEVVSLRAGRANLKDSFVRIIKSELFLLNAHISCLNTTHAFYKHQEKGARKLLMHRKQIDKLFGKVSMEGFTLIILDLYFNDKNKVKATLALAKGKNLHDKRESLKKKQADLDAKMAMKNYKNI
ncbi:MULTISPECIES: SsrA-binding protein SmpB [unclassified Campylobacter]|uniref:SsrA-binding protein SmpB n=1 Tax=unclassified Campylobacter TaxID=2593542 RepID=UPI001237E375|nr:MULTISPECIES: SsrA-binding protein SmpB [unclassified Campylobacter]KAA6225893.1 SsrA-binding protein SmpB [Campylobacter sp. LR185c]KAA6227017.1 SsrA-binding protein SmpB [Campylobacter sp. LR196d]KAA6227588.1 SsrA-binding protein SmpB [Campylobacter sp. LR286c]KAA6229453.1 SsrA-binding protein SmpB [Campylobacter sp. LR264d]KAA6230698.1 SsrA-binding protein SmpB [Campylobacter sp. LR291e]